MNRGAVASLILCGILVVPNVVEAKSFSSGSRASMSRPMSRPSNSSFKSSSKSSSLKPGSSILKPKNGNSVPRANKPKTSNNIAKKNETPKLDLNKNKGASYKSSTSNGFTVKPKTKWENNYNPKYYKSYDDTVKYVPYDRLSNGFFSHYMLYNLFENGKDVTERDIVKELESRGYSKSEIEKILQEGREEQKKNNKNFKYKEKKKDIDWGNILGGTMIFGSIAGAILMFIKRGKE